MFSRIELLVRKEGLQCLNDTKVAIFGLGGVGSYVAESLARSGIGNLILVDGDVVAKSNLNRQLPALCSTVGQGKAAVVGERILDINPKCNLTVIDKFYRPGYFADFVPSDTDYVVDAIDSINDKIDLLVSAYRQGVKIYSSMGMGNKLNPAALLAADISKTHTCPLARKVRQRLKAAGIVKGVNVVFSTEAAIKYENRVDNTIGSMVFVPASAGLLLASLVVRDRLVDCT